MKAISAVIATIMLLMITVSLIGVFYVFSSTLAGTTTSSSGQQASQLTTQLSFCMQIDNIYGNQVTLRNCGKGVIENKSLVVTMDDLKLDSSTATIQEGNSSIVNVSGLLNISLGKHNLKISNGAAVALALVEVLKNGIGSYPDFSGWSDQRTYDCAGFKMMGGYNNFGVGSSTQKTIDMPAGNYAIEFNYYFGDSWDSENGLVFWNDKIIWNKTYVLGGSNLCGGSWGDSNGVNSAVYNATIFHPGGPATIKFNSSLDQNPSDEWFGVNNIKIIGVMKQII